MSGTAPMSGTPGPTGRGMPVTPRASASPIPQVAIGSGMISPANSFVLPATGQLTGLSFRFLFEVWQAANAQALNIDTITADIATLQTQVANINATLGTMSGQISTLQINMTAAQNDIAGLQSTATSLQTQINTINTRLANAGIP